MKITIELDSTQTPAALAPTVAQPLAEALVAPDALVAKAAASGAFNAGPAPSLAALGRLEPVAASIANQSQRSLAAVESGGAAPYLPEGRT